MITNALSNHCSTNSTAGVLKKDHLLQHYEFQQASFLIRNDQELIGKMETYSFTLIIILAPTLSQVSDAHKPGYPYKLAHSHG